MAAKFATGWSATLIADLSTSATILPIRAARSEKLCAILGASDHTYLVLSNGVDAEVVRATCSGGRVVVERSDDPIAVPEGACVRFEVTEQLLADFVTPDNAICEIKGENGIVAEQDGCVVTLTLGADCDQATWRSGNFVFEYSDGCVTRSLADSCILTPGQYTNATITIGENGEICAVSQGANIVYSSNPCCPSCSEDDG